MPLAAAGPRPSAPLAVVTTVVNAALLLWPALWNGYPLIYADTGGYLMRPYTGTLTIGRSALYGVFLTAGLQLDFWPNVLIQAAVTAFLIQTVVRTQGLGGAGSTIAVTTALSGLTALPLYVCQLMPDIMVGWAVLALYLLAFQSAALRRWQLVTLATILITAIACHMATLALSAGLLVVLALTWCASALLSRPRPRLLAAALAVGAGVVLSPLANYLIAHDFRFTPGGANFIFGRLLQDGLVKRYLDARCPDPEIALCADKDALPTTADEWLWAHASPLYRLGNWRGYAPEAERIIVTTLRLYPLEHLRTAARATLIQTSEFRTTLAVSRGDNADTIETLDRLLPAASLVRFHAARQQRERPDLDALNWVHVPAALAAFLVTAFAVAGRGTRTAIRIFAATVLIALLGNAAVCGIFSGPNDRYQSRLVWLAGLAAGVMIGTRLRHRISHRQPAQPETSQSTLTS